MGLNTHFRKNQMTHGKPKSSPRCLSVLPLPHVGHFSFKLSSSCSKPGQRAGPWELCWTRACVPETAAGQGGHGAFSATVKEPGGGFPWSLCLPWTLTGDLALGSLWHGCHPAGPVWGQRWNRAEGHRRRETDFLFCT